MLRSTHPRAGLVLALPLPLLRPLPLSRLPLPARRTIPSWLALIAVLALIAPDSAAAAEALAPTAGVTVSGTVTIPPSPFGAQPDLAGMMVRVEGTWIETLVDPATGQFTLTGVPVGEVPLLLVEPHQFDSFTQESKRTTVTVGPGGASGAGFSLVYHWQDLPGHPPHWGEAAYGEWTAQFVSAQVGFVMFRVRASGPDPERIELHRTTDGGLTWSRIGLWVAEPGWTLFPDMYRTFHFTDADHGLVLAVAPCIPCGACGSGFYRTTNGGASWSFVPLPVPPDSYALGVVRFAEAGPGRMIVLGSSGCAVQGYSGLFWDVLWETNDGGASWTIGTDWTPATGCSALGAHPDGRALALCTPYGSGGGPAAARAANGTWTVSYQNAIVANSGYGPADLPRGGDWLFVSNVGAALPRGLYRSNNLGASWEFLSDPGVSYMDFSSARKGFGIFGGTAGVTYDGGKTWSYQAPGGGICCHGNDIRAFDETHAAWVEGGFGDPNGVSQIFLYHEPWTADLEVRPGLAMPNGYFGGAAENLAIASYDLTAQGPVPLEVTSLTLHADGGGDDVAGVARVRLWKDANGDALVGPADALLATAAYADDDGEAAFAIDPPLALDPMVPERVLVTYDFTAASCPGTAFSAWLTPGTDISAEREDTHADIAPTAPAAYPLSGRALRRGTAIFEDGFESGLGGWQVLTTDTTPDPGDGWRLSGENPANGTFSASIRDDRSHADYGAIQTLVLATPIDLSAPGTYYLQFHHSYQVDPSFVLRVQGSADGGASWTTLACYGSCATWVGQSTGGIFVQQVLPLADLPPGPNVLLRFQFDWSAAWYFNGSWSLDDVQVLRYVNRPPSLEREPGSIAFDPVPGGAASSASPVTMRNDGSSPVVLNSLTLRGKNPGDFELLDAPAPGAEILPCRSRTFSVRFTPIGLGPRTATLEIFSSDPAASVQNILLSGTGTFTLSPEAGTVRTKLTLTGAGFGGAEGRVRIGSTPCEIRSWTPEEIRCVLMTTLVPGPYDVSVRKAATGSPWVTLEGAFAVEPPSLSGLEPESGPPRTLLTIHGAFLSTLSDGARVTLFRSSGGSLLKYPCAIRSWSMDNATGETTITAAVPGKITPGTYDLRVSNRGLAAERPGAFVVP